MSTKTRPKTALAVIELLVKKLFLCARSLIKERLGQRQKVSNNGTISLS